MPRKEQTPKKKTPKKKTKEKSTKKSEAPKMDEDEINRLMQNALDQAKAGAETIVPEFYTFDAISHACNVRNSSSSTSVERKFGILTTPGDCISSGDYVHPELYPFGARA